MEGQANTTLQCRKGRRLVLSSVPMQGHINPMVQLANILHTKGFSISIILNQSNPLDNSKYPHFTFYRIPDGLSEGEASTADFVALLKQLNSNCLEPFRECLVNLLSEPGQEPIACLITDANWYFTQEVADSLKLPRIAFRMTSVCSFLVFDALPLFRAKGYLPKKDPQLEERVVEFPPLKVKDIPVVLSCNPEDGPRYIDRMMQKTKAASALIFNSFEELEENELNKMGKIFGIPIFPIGPLHKYFSASSSSLLEQDQSAISWLDTQAHESVIYVSFGSVAEMSEAQLSEVAWGLANSMQPFLWVIRPGLVLNSQQVESLPSGFLEAINGRGYIVKWAPQQEVLAHPCHWWILDTLWVEFNTGKHMRRCSNDLFPFFGDQMVNSRYVNDVWKVGLQLEKGLYRGEIESTIRKLMVEKEGQEIRARVKALKEKINFCLEKGGSSYQSLESFIDYILSDIAH